MFYFTNKKGERIKYDTSRIIPLHSNIATPSYDYITETTDLGQMLVLDRHLQPRSIDVVFLLKGYDFQDTYLLRDELYRLLAQENELYLHEKEVPYKRWKVILQGEQMGDKGYTHASYSLSFIAVNGYAESTASTLSKKTFDENVWQFGQGLTWDENNKYIHSTNKFTINNIGDIAINPAQMPLKIEVLGQTKNLQIINHTNGSKWTYNGSTLANDRILLDGINSYMNNTNIFCSTNKQLIKLERGKNEIELIGATNTTTTFDFRFYYY